MNDELFPHEPPPSNVQVARVLVDQLMGRSFDYRIPDGWEDQVVEGSRVRVPFGGRQALGTIVAVGQPSDVAPSKLRDIHSLVSDRPEFNPSLLSLAQWMAKYYCCEEELALRTALPQVVRHGKVLSKKVRWVTLTHQPSSEELEKLERRAPKQARILQHLITAGPDGQKASELLTRVRTSQSALTSLARQGLIKLEQVEERRDPHAGETFVADQALVLSPEQAVVMQQFQEQLAQEKPRPLLLHGVTGSGKTEIYLQAMSMVLSQGKTALVLVPEISLTPQTVERFQSRFQEQAGIAVLHSHLSEGERFDEWQRIHKGQAQIVIGARSAIFAPLERLGLIVVDEEHEGSYKQEEAPRYQARDLAVLRGHLEKAVVLLGSATPSLESYRNAHEGKYQLVQLTERIDGRSMPLIRVVDMREETRKYRKAMLISDGLRSAMEKRLQRGEQTILFLNRRGYASALVCPACGHVCECPHCSVGMTWHRTTQRMLCHFCEYAELAPDACPQCKTPGLKFGGAGTERIEDTLAKLFPRANLLRMDADSMRRKGAYRDALQAFGKKKADILIGTQMIAKGLHFPNVTLVGIMNADLGLHLPDFRAGERTFQLIVQVAGRAGRGEMEGEVFVQTYTPESAAIQFARHHNYQGFWDAESETRHSLHYPPYTHLVLLAFRGRNEDLVKFTAENFERRLQVVEWEGQVTISPANPAPIAKIQDEFRYHIILRTTKVKALNEKLRGMVLGQSSADVRIIIDVDATNLL
ncbi:MAG: primosomal protein N' [Verrucomicrobiales bacterium]